MAIKSEFPTTTPTSQGVNNTTEKSFSSPRICNLIKGAQKVGLAILALGGVAAIVAMAFGGLMLAGTFFPGAGWAVVSTFGSAFPVSITMISTSFVIASVITTLFFLLKERRSKDLGRGGTPQTTRSNNQRRQDTTPSSSSDDDKTNPISKQSDATGPQGNNHDRQDTTPSSSSDDDKTNPISKQSDATGPQGNNHDRQDTTSSSNSDDDARLPDLPPRNPDARLPDLPPRNPVDPETSESDVLTQKLIEKVHLEDQSLQGNQVEGAPTIPKRGKFMPTNNANPGPPQVRPLPPTPEQSTTTDTASTKKTDRDLKSRQRQLDNLAKNLSTSSVKRKDKMRQQGKTLIEETDKIYGDNWDKREHYCSIFNTPTVEDSEKEEAEEMPTNNPSNFLDQIRERKKKIGAKSNSYKPLKEKSNNLGFLGGALARVMEIKKEDYQVQTTNNVKTFGITERNSDMSLGASVELGDNRFIVLSDKEETEETDDWSSSTSSDKETEDNLEETSTIIRKPQLLAVPTSYEPVIKGGNRYLTFASVTQGNFMKKTLRQSP